MRNIKVVVGGGGEKERNGVDFGSAICSKPCFITWFVDSVMVWLLNVHALAKFTQLPDGFTLHSIWNTISTHLKSFGELKSITD